MAKDKCTLSDSELIAKANEWTLKLCNNHNNWMLRVPPDCNQDPDMIFSELAVRFKKLVEKPTVGIFYEIFDYGNENSGVLMFKRFKKQFNSDIELFKNHLCSIDRAKWDKYFSNR